MLPKIMQRASFNTSLFEGVLISQSSTASPELEEPIYSLDYGDKGTNYTLAYDRHGGSWKLLIRENSWHHIRSENGNRVLENNLVGVYEAEWDEAVDYPVSSAPRIARIKAVGQLDNLVAEISKEAERLSKEINGD